MRKFILSFLALLPFSSFSQENPKSALSGIQNIKITGYLQTQFQKAQSSGINSWSGGDFDENSDSRFMIRRGRIKVQKDDKFASMVFQLDGTQDGMRIMDAYIELHPENDNSISLTAGLFNRPFGYSLAYSSNERDFPERARVFQTIAPRERDLGAMLSYNPKNVLPFLTAQFAVVNGTGISAKDYDGKKDMIGNLTFQFDSLANKKLHLGFGTSFYKGTVRNNTETYFSPTNNGFVANNKAQNKGSHFSRNYYGANFQIAYNNSFGTTSFKTEYVKGKQPGVASSSSISGFAASTSFATQPTGDLYLRNFDGYYFWLTQQIADTKLVAIVSYDTYDPNTNLSESEIGSTASQTTAGDIKFSTLGYGLTYTINSKLKLTLYNEHVKNKSTQLTDYRSDVKDNVFTTRLQYRW